MFCIFNVNITLKRNCTINIYQFSKKLYYYLQLTLVCFRIINYNARTV